MGMADCLACGARKGSNGLWQARVVEQTFDARGRT